MLIANKCIEVPRYPGRRMIVASVVALIGLIPSARAAIPEIEPPPPAVSPASTIADSFGSVLSVAELAAAAGKGLFARADTNVLISLLTAIDNNGRTVGEAAAPDLQHARGAGGMGMAAIPTAGIQVAALDGFSPTAELNNHLLQSQNATVALDASLRYLCSDKIYADIYPSGTGVNNHAYSGCGAGGGLDPDRPSPTLTNLPVPSSPPPNNPGGGYTIIPCGGSIANISSMTIGPSGAAPTIASLSSFTSLLGRGHR